MANEYDQMDDSDGDSGVGEENVIDVPCVYCNPLVEDEVRKMPEDLLRFHVAVCHVDLQRRPDECAVYLCDGNKDSCDKYGTLAVNDFVEHMELEHPDLVVPYQTRYKAALSDLMTELCVYRLAEETSPDSDDRSSASADSEVPSEPTEAASTPAPRQSMADKRRTVCESLLHENSDAL